MRIAIASGKGGTGKTTIATNLARVLADAQVPTTYLDCDVEEPNGHLFLKPEIISRREVTVPVPRVDESRCTWCGACGEACRSSALLILPKKILTFPQLCSGCGGCVLACPEEAITEVQRSTGAVELGHAGAVGFIHGRLNVGDAKSPPVIRAVLDAAPPKRTLILDAPPGTACPVITSIRTADVVLLVTEPTPFGLNDLALAVDLVRDLGLPFAVVVNRVGIGDNWVFEYCEREGIRVLLRLPNDREIAAAYSRGELAVDALPHLRPLFLDMFNQLAEIACHSPARRPRAVSVAPATALPRARTPSASLTVTSSVPVHDLVVVSGKGGTGKTSLVASFCALAGKTTAADLDVDAADLHLVLAPTVRQRWPFISGQTAVIDPVRCTACGACAQYCRFDAIRIERPAGTATVTVDPVACEGCGVCVDCCADGAVELVPSAPGEWFLSETRHGALVHARLGVAQQNSGKLVALVRREAKAVAASAGEGRVICDGAPGIGCPVISSVTGARLVLIVTEPTPSGLHDLIRVAGLTHRFGIPTAICINKADLNPEVTDEIEMTAATLGLLVVGHIRYDDAVTAAQLRGLSVVELGDGPAAQEIRAVWERVRRLLGETRDPTAPEREPMPQLLVRVPSERAPQPAEK